MSAPVAILIEDEPQIRRFVRAALEGEGWTVHEADTAKRGLLDAGTRKPDLLIVDLGLPDGDGLVNCWPACGPTCAAPGVALRTLVRRPEVTGTRYSASERWRWIDGRGWSAAMASKCT
jgi:hypothetical protein